MTRGNGRIYPALPAPPPVRTAVLAALAVLVVAGAAGATPPATAPADTLTLADAVGRVLQHNPDLKAEAEEVAALRALVDQARKRPNPSLSLEVENVAGSGPYGGTRAAEATLSLAQVLERGGKQGARVALAEAEHGLGSIVRRALELDVLRQTVDRFLDLLAVQELAEIARERLQLVAAESLTVARQVAVGAVMPLELTRVRIDRQRARLELYRLEAEVAAARASLAALWGEPIPAPFTAAGDLGALPPLPTRAELQERLDRNPDLQRWLLEAQRRAAALAVAEASARPDLEVSLGLRRFREGGGDGALVLGASIDLPVRDRRRGEREAARRRLAAVPQRQQARRDAALGRLAALRERLAATREAAVLLAERILPEARQAVREAEAAHAKGRIGYTDVISVRDAYLAVRRDLVLTHADSHRLHAELERLTGGSPAADDHRKEASR